MSEKKQTWAASLIKSDQAIEAETQGPGPWEKTAAALGGAASFAVDFGQGAVHSGLQDFVSTAFGLNPSHPQAGGEKDPEPAQEHDKDHDDGMDR